MGCGRNEDSSENRKSVTMTIVFARSFVRLNGFRIFGKTLIVTIAEPTVS